MRILLLEDPHCDQLSPIALLRPVFELVCGRDSLRRRLQRWFPTADFGAWVRPWLAAAYGSEQTEVRVNDIDWLRKGQLLVINGRWLPEKRLTPLDFVTHQAGFVNGVPVWMLLEGRELAELLHGDLQAMLGQFAAMHRPIPASGELIEYPWDLIRWNSRQLQRDFSDEGVTQPVDLPHVQVLGPPADVYVSSQAVLDPYVVIDVRSGPVSIDREAHVQSFTRIEGPCHIGRGTQIFRALIRGGTTIGEHCRVGGEIEESILHGYVNKYHEGFIGHSYVCPWVNIGAMSCTSDLKNDYSTVRVPLSGVPVDTGLDKVGSFIGDHSKAAMDSMFNTGTSVGVMSMVLPGGRLLPRHVPSFSSVTFGALSADVDLDSAIDTARKVMLRRGQILTAQAEQLLRSLQRMTEPERTRALDRMRHHQRSTPAVPSVPAASSAAH